MDYTDTELEKMGYKRLGRLLGSAIYKGEEYRKISRYYIKAKDENRY